MNKRVGFESMAGIGGGVVSEESRRQLEIAEDLCRKRRPVEALPYLHRALDADPYNLDAYIQLAFLAPNFETSVEMLETAESKGKTYACLFIDRVMRAMPDPLYRLKGREMLISEFGPRCFSDDGEQVGHFWGILETRPYMRVLQALVRFYVEKKDYPKAAHTVIEMLRLCPGDNLGQRDWLGSLLIMSKRMEDALYFSQVWMDPDCPDVIPRGGCNFKKPSAEPLSPALMKRLGEYNKATLLYDAAYASFRIWGDCTLAKQYLQIAAKLNPIVLVKILSKATRQESLSSAPRSLNSPEDASDYLWLAQDLWLQPDAWNWVNSQEEVTRLLLKKCSRGGCSNTEKVPAEFKRCAGCHKVWYCGSDCQKTDWKSHKKPCKDEQRMKIMLKSISQGRPLDTSKLPFAAATADFSSTGAATQFHGA
ncbi:hypothetical protein EIP91_011114 [Steccherinum ochraceum]|uniref:MYND-type domain-containing protein n=1 Tax=Steccherinum ochraceum TaxID=92696 RepID=A0A4R0RUU1_9APHY|nr:hypothetical protein EIP91_011114 [Steccherinum ochraceum]